MNNKINKISFPHFHRNIEIVEKKSLAIIILFFYNRIINQIKERKPEIKRPININYQPTKYNIKVKGIK